MYSRRTNSNKFVGLRVVRQCNNDVKLSDHINMIR